MTAPVLPIPHNWREEVEHKVTWPTDVQRAQSGQEQRFRLSDRARETLRYHLTVADVRASTRLLAVLHQATDGRIRQPRWEDGVRLTTPAAAGTTGLGVLTHDPALRAFAVGGAALVWRRVDAWEVVTVESVATGQLVLAAPGLARDWPQATWILPLAEGVIANQAEVQRYGGAVGELPLEVRLGVLPAGGEAVAPVVASLQRMPGAPTVINRRRALRFRVVARDATGAILPDVPVSVSHTNPGLFAVHATNVPGVIYCRHLGGATGTTTITATAGAVALEWTVNAAS